jgi:hypothetical protein
MYLYVNVLDHKISAVLRWSRLDLLGVVYSYLCRIPPIDKKYLLYVERGIRVYPYPTTSTKISSLHMWKADDRRKTNKRKSLLTFLSPFQHRLSDVKWSTGAYIHRPLLCYICLVSDRKALEEGSEGTLSC